MVTMMLPYADRFVEFAEQIREWLDEHDYPDLDLNSEPTFRIRVQPGDWNSGRGATIEAATNLEEWLVEHGYAESAEQIAEWLAEHVYSDFDVEVVRRWIDLDLDDSPDEYIHNYTPDTGSCWRCELTDLPLGPSGMCQPCVGAVNDGKAAMQECENLGEEFVGDLAFPDCPECAP